MKGGTNGMPPGAEGMGGPALTPREAAALRASASWIMRIESSSSSCRIIARTWRYKKEVRLPRVLICLCLLHSGLRWSLSGARLALGVPPS